MTDVPNCLTNLVMDYHETVISFDARDYSYIRNYSLKLVLSEDATHFSKPFPMKQAECDIMNEQLAAMEATGIIVRASDDCQFVCNAFLVRKNAESKMTLDPSLIKYRIVCNFIPLNKLLLFNTDRYNVFGVNNLLVKVGSLRKGPGAIYSVIDLKSFFHSLPIAPESRR